MKRYSSVFAKNPDFIEMRLLQIALLDYADSAAGARGQGVVSSFHKTPINSKGHVVAGRCKNRHIFPLNSKAEKAEPSK
ncbi:hypothetical protein OH764_19140 [Burkholderia sp. M6-3]